ncbi:hypothetical protein F5884DRAFT_743163 [Xylogone sp. PMI_703]|nr:hypothetical protein F5884DRAFT_743163 [Xylogone sp. PMI_703]
MPGVTKEPLRRNHYDMNKFGNASEASYRSVRNAITKIADSLLDTRKNSLLDGADARLRNYYASAQRLDVQRISGDILSMDQCYINLAVVEQSHSANMSNTPQYSPFSILARLKVETINEDKRVHLPRLFDSRKLPDGTNFTPKRILIRGRAGVGKTTLCKKIVHDYLHHNMWCQLFDLLLWVPLRRLKKDNLPEKYTFVDLFHDLYFSEHENGRGLARELSESIEDPNKKDKILFILDGLDEVSQEWNSETPMQNVLLRLLGQPQVIITSRPYGINLNRLGPLDLELETIGFDENQVETYIRKVVTKDETRTDGILNFIRKHALIKGLVRIPIQLDALCYSWDSSFMSGTEPKTMTTLYQAIVLKLWQKDVLRLRKSDKDINEYTVHTLEDFQIQELVPDEINLLESLAFVGIYNGIIQFNKINRRAIYTFLKRQGTSLPDSPDTILKRISFLHTSDIEVMDQDRSYHFLHLTFQEFFAARYFIKHWTKGEQLHYIDLKHKTLENFSITPQEFLQKEKYNSRYNILWRFVAGLLQDENNTVESLKCFFQGLEAEPRDLLGPTHQRILMHCLSEVTLDRESGFGMRVQIEQHLLQWLRFECNFHDKAWLCRERECPEHLIETLLDEESIQVKTSVLRALSEQQGLSKRILQVLVPLLKDEDEDVRSEAAKALRQQANLPLDILQTLILLLKDEDSDVRSWAVEALRQQANLSLDIFQALILLLKDKNWDVRYKAVKTLSQQANLQPDILQALILLLKDENWSMRSGAIEVLSQQANLPLDILQALILLLKDKTWDVRSGAVKVLRQQANLSPDILQVLIPLLKDEDSDMRSRAVKVLSQQTNLPPDILQALIPLLKDKNWSVRSVTTEALGKHSEFYTTLLNLSKQDWKFLYRVWLKRSFEDQICCYLMDNSFYIDTPEGLQTVSVGKRKQGELKNKIQEAQLALVVPSYAPPEKRKADTQKSWMTRLLFQ